MTATSHWRRRGRNNPTSRPTTEAMLTLVTCYPKWDNYKRLIIHAKVTGSQPKSQGRPAELTA
ncbi:MAG: sortase [Micromonosporaceae bacterium]|nr:sortase [Micromonosporaceae bacterium]